MVVTRFAPSPTWYVHIWSLRTVLYNYLFAKWNNWRFLLRIEDTDQTRYVEGSVENMIQVLASVWLIPDEWPNNPWKLGPYFQSERLDIYSKYVNELIEKDNAYYCFCSAERLEELRAEQTSLGLPTKYDKKCRYLTAEEIKANLDAKKPYVVRLKVPDNEEIVFEDIIKWKVKVNSKDIDDQVLLKSDWFPTYHLAVVVDDHLMEITHVIRWEEWVPSTPKHILLYKAFWWQPTVYAHLPSLVWADRKKLSKRTWDVAVESYLSKWYLTEAIINYIALLGWNPKTTEEFFTMDELIKRFNLNDVHKAWAFFDIERLKFFNSHYLKTLDINYIYDKIVTYLSKYDPDFYKIFMSHDKEYNLKVIEELRTRVRYLEEFKELTSFLYSEPREINKGLLLNPKMKIEDIETAKKWLEIALQVLNSRDKDFDNIEEIKNLFIDEIAKAEMKNGQVLWPVRVALSWEEFSPGALELIYILWITESKTRIEKTLITL